MYPFTHFSLSTRNTDVVNTHVSLQSVIRLANLVVGHVSVEVLVHGLLSVSCDVIAMEEGDDADSDLGKKDHQQEDGELWQQVT